MANIEKVKAFWQDIECRDYESLKTKFNPSAVIDWNNQNERFNVANFITANEYYPGKWRITVEKVYEVNETVISVALCEMMDEKLHIEHSFYATSFFEFEKGVITYLSEYYSDNTPAPQWRQELKLSTPIK